MKKRKRQPAAKRSGRPPRGSSAEPVGLRIVGGRFRGRKLQYGGDRRVRPMKDRVREAVFNLIGPAVRGTHVVDLFAGTGALAFEALSRGAVRATLFEQHLPTIRILEQNAAYLAVDPLCEVLPGDVFIRVQGWRPEGGVPWLVFSSPPYDFYVDRHDEMLRMLRQLIDDSPPGSIFVVESDDRFDFGELPEVDAWRQRQYAPAKVGVYYKETS